MDAHHGEGAPGDARVVDVCVPSALVQKQPVAHLLQQVDRRRVRLDGARDPSAGLELRFCSDRTDHYPDLFSFPCFLACRSPARKTASPSGTATTPITISGQMSCHSSVSPFPFRIDSRAASSA